MKLARKYYIYCFLLFVIIFIIWRINVEGKQGEFLSSPNWSYIFGTDAIGRSVFISTISGAIDTLFNSTQTLLVSLAIGIVAAIVSSLYIDRTLDRIIIIMVETIRSFPGIILIILLLSFGIPVNIAISVFFWTPAWRILRNLIVIQRKMPYAINARLFGYTEPEIIILEILPNVTRQFAYYVPVIFAEIVSSLSAIKFLGIGGNIEKPSLGSLIAKSLELGFSAYWVWLPGLIILIAFIWFMVIFSVKLKSRQTWMSLE